MKINKYCLLLILFFITRLSFSQNDYMISSNGYNFEELDNNNIYVKIYLTAYNLGALTKWNDDIKDFKLFSEINKEYYKLSSYMPLFDIENSGSSPVFFNLKFIVPKDARQIVLKLPEKYGGLKISLYQNSYNTQQNLNASKNNYDAPFSLSDHLGFYFGIPYQIKSINSSSINTLGVGIGILPKITTFGKSNNTVLFADLKAEFNFGLNWGANSFNKLYNLDNNKYQVSETYTDSSTSNTYIYSLGIGVFHYLGDVSPMVSLSAAYMKNVFFDLTVHDLENEKKFDPSFGAWGIRVDIGLSIMKYLYAGYSFGSFTPKTNVDILNKQIITNSIQIGVKGF